MRSNNLMLLDDHIHLVPYTPGHVDALYSAAIESRKELAPFMPWCHSGYQVEEARRFIESEMKHFREGVSFEFAILSGSGDFLGGCGLNQVDTFNLRANLGYWVRTGATGRGIATAAVQQLSNWAWANTQLNRLEIVVSTRNPASCRVAEKAGAVYEGTARLRLVLHGTAHDARIYSLIRSVS